MIKISKVQVQEKDNTRFNLYTEGDKYLMSVSAENLAPYGYGEFEISKEDLEELKNKESKNLVYKQAASYVSRAMKTSFELRIYLRKKDVDEDLIDDVIYEMNELGLIDDKAYLEIYVEDRYKYSLDGPMKIKEKLYRKGFDSKEVEPYLEKYKEMERENLKELINSQKSTSRGKDKNKLIRYLMGKGYYYGMIKDELSIIEEI